MGEDSIYEKQRRSDGIAMGRITRVFPETRLCEVKTFLGSGDTDDNHIPDCEWINLDAHPDGDESGVIPRAGAFGLVFFVSGEPFIFGFFNPLTGTGSAETGTEKEPLNEGDRVLKTIGGNRIIMRAHGEIQIESTKTCRTIYFPDRNIINTLCRNYEFRTDGGTIDWVNLDDNANHTFFRKEYRDAISRDNVIVVENGFIDSGEFISRTEIGIGSANGGTEAPIWTRTIKPDGETVLFIRASGAAAGHKTTIKPSGETEVNIADKTTLKILPTGETTLDVGPGKATINIKPDGTVSMDFKGSTTIKSTKDMTLDTSANLNAKVGGNLDAKITGLATIDCAKATVKAISNVVKGGAVTDNALNNDPITGIPLQGVGGVDLV